MCIPLINFSIVKAGKNDICVNLLVHDLKIGKIARKKIHVPSDQKVIILQKCVPGAEIQQFVNSKGILNPYKTFEELSIENDSIIIAYIRANENMNFIEYARGIDYHTFVTTCPKEYNRISDLRMMQKERRKCLRILSQRSVENQSLPSNNETLCTNIDFKIPDAPSEDPLPVLW